MDWDKATPRERHRPPHWMGDGVPQFITAATHNRVPYLLAPERRDWFLSLLHELAERKGLDLVAWVILKEHYHLIIRPGKQEAMAIDLKLWMKRLHWISSCRWNEEDGTEGRQVWYHYWDSNLWTDGDFWSRINYIHANPVKHGYTEDPISYQWSSMRLLTDEWDDPVPLKGLAKFPAPRKLPNDDF